MAPVTSDGPHETTRLPEDVEERDLGPREHFTRSVGSKAHTLSEDGAQIAHLEAQDVNNDARGAGKQWKAAGALVRDLCPIRQAGPARTSTE
jgi:hypothetical protein